MQIVFYSQANVFRSDATKIEPMHALSCLAAEERMFFNILFSSLLKNNNNENYYIPQNIDSKPGFLRALGAIGSCASFRLEMGRRYLEDRSIKLKEKAKDVIKNFGLFETDSAVVTLNWDNSLWQLSYIKNLTHLHGRCSDPMTMIFPTETIYEHSLQSILVEQVIDDLKIFAEQHKEKECFDLFLERYFVSDKRYKNLFDSENYLSEWLKEASEIYFCGIAFNTYDHELTNSFGMYSSNKKWDRIVVFNRENDKEIKINRISGILRQNPALVEFVKSEFDG